MDVMSNELSPDVRPVVVIGAARSGTKFLRDLIGSSAHCSVVPHDVNYIWRFGNEESTDDALAASDCTDSIATFIRKRLLAAAVGSGARSDQPMLLVEKTVSNCLRVPFVDRVLPNALYVHLLRDGRNVLESSVRKWREPVRFTHLLKKVRSFPLSNLAYATWYLRNVIGAVRAGDRGVRVWGVRYPGIEHDLNHLSVPEICAKQWRECVETAMRDLAEISAERVIEIRYEKLTSQHGEVERLCEFLGLTDSSRVLDHYQRENRPGRVKDWRGVSDALDWDAAMGILRPTLQHVGYS